MSVRYVLPPGALGPVSSAAFVALIKAKPHLGAVSKEARVGLTPTARFREINLVTAQVRSSGAGRCFSQGHRRVPEQDHDH